MVETDTMSGSVSMRVAITQSILESTLTTKGRDFVLDKVKPLTDGTGNNQITVILAGEIAAATGGSTVSLANASDPFGAGGSSVATGTVEELKLRFMALYNSDATNFCTLKKGTNGVVGFLGGTTDGVIIGSEAPFLWYSKAGSTAVNDGVDDELLFTADTAATTILAVFGFG